MTPSVGGEESEQDIHRFLGRLLSGKAGPIVIAVLQGVLRVAVISLRLP
jgi:hypothetical protein